MGQGGVNTRDKQVFISLDEGRGKEQFPVTRRKGILSLGQLFSAIPGIRT